MTRYLIGLYMLELVIVISLVVFSFATLLFWVFGYRWPLNRKPTIKKKDQPLKLSASSLTNSFAASSDSKNRIS